MGERPAGKTLDRWPNNDGNYEPGNCRWATPTEQAWNSSTTRQVEFGGDTLPMGEWGKRGGMARSTIARRLARGWPKEQALTAPPVVSNFAVGTHYIEHDGERLCLSEWARRAGISRGALLKRLRKGMSIGEALSAPLNISKRTRYAKRAA